MSTQRKRKRFLNARRDGNSYTLKPEGHLSLRAEMGNENAPEVLAVVALPTAEERRRREVMRHFAWTDCVWSIFLG